MGRNSTSPLTVLCCSVRNVWEEREVRVSFAGLSDETSVLEFLSDMEKFLKIG